ncbi:threonine/serine ThrE exporter family protein [Gordonia iterans]
MSDEPCRDAAPDDGEMLALITAVGVALNRPSYPVTETAKVLREICRAYDFDATAQVFATYIVTLDEKKGATEIANSGPGFRFDQIAATEDVVHRLRHADVPVAEALATLRKISSARPPVNPFLRIVGYMFMALGFAFCFRMSFAASVAAVVVAIPIAAIQIWFSAKGALAALMPFMLTFISALAITLWAVHGGLPDPVRVAVIPVLTLIPGAMLTTALIELSAGDQITGSSRLVYALVVLMSMAFGLALAIDLIGIGSQDLRDLTSQQAPYWVMWVAAPVYAVGNLMYFCTPRRAWWWTVFFCFITFWFTNLLQHWMNAAFAGGVGMGAALLACWAVNAHDKNRPSVLVMFLPAFWLMVPGSMGFVAISGAITQDHALSSLGTGAALSLLSMAICMMLAAVLAPAITRPLRLRRSARTGTAAS